jgi:hypothetical protein
MPDFLLEHQVRQQQESFYTCLEVLTKSARDMRKG